MYARLARKYRILREHLAARKIRSEGAVVTGFAPWRARAGHTDVQTILASVHTSLHRGYGPDLTLGGQGVDKIQSSDVSEYDDLLRRLKRLGGLAPATMADLFLRRSQLKGVPIAFWHDVDSDIETALKMARIEAEHGFRGTYYIHYCSLYYGDFYRRSLTRRGRLAFDGFERNVAMAGLYREIQSLGHEVGFHFNPYGVFRQKHMDGLQAMAVELAWMRRVGLTIEGGAGHSSYNRQGADPYEIFRELTDDFTHIYEGARHARTSFDFDNVRMPRLALSHKAFGLDYVADFILRDSRFEFWAKAGIERYRTGNPGSLQSHDPRLTTSIDAVASVEGSLDTPPAWIIFNSHPAHYGQRAHPDRAREAEARAGSITTADAPALGRMAYAPARLHVTRYAAPSGAMRTVLVHSDGEGFLDYPLGTDKDRGRPVWLLLGGTLIDCPHLPLSVQPQGWLRDISRRAGDPIAAHKRALPDSSTTDLERYLDAFAPLQPISRLSVFLGADVLAGEPAGGDIGRLAAWCGRIAERGPAQACEFLVGDLAQPNASTALPPDRLAALEGACDAVAAVVGTRCRVVRLSAVIGARSWARTTPFGLDAHDTLCIARHLWSRHKAG